MLVSPIAHKGLLLAKGDLWRRSRRILTPSFSTLKLKVVRSCDLVCVSIILIVYIIPDGAHHGGMFKSHDAQVYSIM